MSYGWNSLIVPFDEKKKIACKTFVDSKGDSIVLSNGFFHLKSVICEFEKNIDSFAYLASNNSTYYDIDQDTKNVMLEYSPLTLLRIQQRKNESKLYEVENSFPINFKQTEELCFYLLDLDKKKVANISKLLVHVYYKFC